MVHEPLSEMPEIGMDLRIEKYTVQSFTKFNNILHGNGQLLKNEQKDHIIKLMQVFEIYTKMVIVVFKLYFCTFHSILLTLKIG